MGGSRKKMIREEEEEGELLCKHLACEMSIICWQPSFVILIPEQYKLAGADLLHGIHTNALLF